MILETIADYLEDEGIGTVGTDIFISELPDNINNSISLVLSPSVEPNKAIPYFYQTVDIWARFSKYSTGYDKLKEAFDLLHSKVDYDLDQYHIYLSFANGMIQDNDRDVNRRHLFQLTLTFIYHEQVDFS